MNTATQPKKIEFKPQVFMTDYGHFLVDSEDRTLLYKVVCNGETFCSCPDYTKKSKDNPEYHCVHIEAVLKAEESNIFKFERAVNTSVKSVLRDEFIKSIDGKDFVVYSGLLDLAHQKGLKSIEVELLQFPTKENDNLAVCRATALSHSGDIYIDFGDANPQNCNPKVAKHLIRLASTRAKARTLRDMTNVGITCLEELGDFNDVIGEEQKQHAARRNTARKAEEIQQKTEPPKDTKATPKENKPPVQQKAQNVPPVNESPKKESAPPISEAQRRAIQNLSSRRGIPEKKLNDMAQENFGIPITNLSTKDAASFIRILQQAS